MAGQIFILLSSQYSYAVHVLIKTHVPFAIFKIIQYIILKLLKNYKVTSLF